MSLTIKAFLKRKGSEKTEIRRFSIPADVSSCYVYLVKKLAAVFSSLLEGQFTITWKDSDLDDVCLSSDEELVEALGFVEDAVLRLYLVPTEVHPINENEGVVHPGIVCDGCNGSVHGSRYKCVVCPDYDLCEACDRKNLHGNHNMVKLVKPVNSSSLPPFGPPFGPFQPPHGPPFRGPRGRSSSRPGEPFMPPPYLRQWMKSYMRQWHKKNVPGCTHADSSEEEDTQKGPKKFHIKKSAGKCQQEKVKNDQEKKLVSATSDQAQKPDVAKVTKSTEAEPTTIPEVAMTTEPELTREAEIQPTEVRRIDVRPGHQYEELWIVDDEPVSRGTSVDPTPAMTPTVMTTGQVTQPPMVTSETTATSQPAFVSTPPHVTQALHQMLSMGFTNDGGWLVRLLEDKDGDIIRVLDAIKPQQSRCRQVNGGTLA